jgi:large subunit ribosomal protein L32
MAVPKKRTGHSAQGHRRSNWKATKPETTKCLNCGEIVLTHTVCTACGYYKGKAVSIKSPNYTETAVEIKKPAKQVKSEKEKVKSEAEVVEKTEKVKKVKATETVESAEVVEVKDEVKEKEEK